MERYEALLTPKEVFAELPDWAGFIPFVEHVRIIENSLLRDLNRAMQQATSDEQFAILEDQELALIDAISHWAGLKGWWLVGRDGRWKCCPLRGQSCQFTPMLQPGDEAIADPLDFRQVYVKRDGRFIPPPQACAVEPLRELLVPGLLGNKPRETGTILFHNINILTNGVRVLVIIGVC